MPSSIPYNPSLVLGSIVKPAAVKELLQMSSLLAPVDAAQETLNSYIALKRSLQMTVDELANMNIMPGELIEEIQQVDADLQKAAVDYATVRSETELKLQPLRANMPSVNAATESPIDFKVTELKPMPLAADSLNMDSQYFTYDKNDQDATNTVGSIRSFVSGSLAIMDTTIAGEVARTTANQINRQRQSHDIAGTLVITATCTHRLANVFAPLVLDVDKAIRAWNDVHPNSADKIKPTVEFMTKALAGEGKADEPSIQIISGVTYGSSFVGMAHVLHKQSTTSSQDMESKVFAAEVTAQKDSFFSSQSGGMGLDDEQASDIKKMLSTESVSSHVTVISNGVIMSIAPSDIATAVDMFVESNEANSMANLATMATQAGENSNQGLELAAQARTGQSMADVRRAEITSVLSAISKMEATTNKVLDVNSLVKAFDDYVGKAKAGGAIGVPLNYYLKPITLSQIAHLWINKYYPGRTLEVEGDDRKAAAEKSGT